MPSIRVYRNRSFKVGSWISLLGDVDGRHVPGRLKRHLPDRTLRSSHPEEGRKCSSWRSPRCPASLRRSTRKSFTGSRTARVARSRHPTSLSRGLLVHIAGQRENGFCIVDIFESEEAVEDFRRIWEQFRKRSVSKSHRSSSWLTRLLCVDLLSSSSALVRSVARLGRVPAGCRRFKSDPPPKVVVNLSRF